MRTTSPRAGRVRRQADVIQVLLAYAALVGLWLVIWFVQRARGIDRVATLTLIVLGLATRPTLHHHEVEVMNAAVVERTAHRVMLSHAARAAAAVARVKDLEFTDCLVFSVTSVRGVVVGVGLFGRVFMTV